MQRLELTVTARYSKRTTTLRPALRTTKTGKSYLVLTRRQIREAEGRACYAGVDGLILPTVKGYAPWIYAEDGSALCFAVE